MLHEIAHGLGIKYTTDGKQSVQEALGDLGHVIEEGKADLVGLFIAKQLHDWGKMTENDLFAIYISSLVSLLYNCDARQSIVRLNFFKEPVRAGLGEWALGELARGRIFDCDTVLCLHTFIH